MPELKKGITGKGFAIGLILTIVLVVVNTFNAYFWMSGEIMASISKEPLYWFSGALYAFFLPLFVIAVLPKRLRLSKSELTLIFSMMAIAYPLTANPYQIQWFLTNYAHAGPGVIVNDYSTPVIQKGLAHIAGWSTDDVVFPGGFVGRPTGVAVPVPWGRFLPVILGTSFWWLSLLLLQIFVAAILREQFVEIEELSFPNSEAAKILVENVAVDGDSSDRSGLLANKSIWLGVLIATILSIPTYIYTFVPGVTADSLKPLTMIDIVIPYVPVQIAWNVPALIGFGLLMPLNSLLSLAITWIVIVVVFLNVWTHGLGFAEAGYLVPGEATMENYVARLWKNPTVMSWLVGQRTAGFNFFAADILIVSVFWMLWLNRSHVATVFKRIASPSEGEGFFGYRGLFIGAIVFAVLYLGFGAFAGAYVEVLLVSLVIWILFFMGQSRARAENGMIGGMQEGDVYMSSSIYCFSRLWTFNKFGGSEAMTGMTGDPLIKTPLLWTTIMVENPWVVTGNPASPMPTTLEAFRLAHQTNTDHKHILLGTIIAAIIAIPTSIIIWMWFSYEAPWIGGGDLGMRAYLRPFAAGLLAVTGEPVGWRNIWYYAPGFVAPVVDSFLQLHAIGVILAVVLFALRARFAWWIYDPFAMVIWAGTQAMPYAFFASIVSLIVKFMVVRVYGANVYEKRLAPLAVGLIVGSGFAFTINALAQYAVLPYRLPLE